MSLDLWYWKQNCWYHFVFSGHSLQRTGSRCRGNTNQHLCMVSTSLQYRLMQLRYHGVVKSTHWTYQLELIAYTSFCSHFNINPLSATSPTLQCFCADRLQFISYKTLKVYLAAIRLMHIKQGLPDPITDESLHVVYGGSHHCQSIPERKRLPITTDILKNLNHNYACLTTL